MVVGAGLLVVAVLLAVDVLRGGRGESEGGEDVDLSEPSDWRTVLLLAGVFLAFAVLIGPVGFPSPEPCSSGARPTPSAAATSTATR